MVKSKVPSGIRLYNDIASLTESSKLKIAQTANSTPKEQIELPEPDKSGMRVAEYLTELPEKVLKEVNRDF